MRLSPQREQMQYRSFGGHGASTDIFVASARAYVNALNKAIEALDLHNNNNDAITND